MGSNYHTPYTSATTIKPESLNPPFAELDRAITYLKNVIVSCDGNITYDKTTGILSWSGTIRIHFNRADGDAVLNTVATGSVTLSDNEFAYADLSETDGQAIAISKAAITTDSPSNYITYNRIVMAYRNATSDEIYPVYLRPIWGSAGTHERDHDINSTADHNGVAGATENNLISFDANKLPKDSGIAVSDITIAITKSQIYDVACTFNSMPGSGAIILRIPFVRSVTFPASMTGSRGVLGTAPTNQADFDLRKGNNGNGGVSFGTMRFAAAATTATFISAAGASFVAGNVLTVVAPNPQDPTLQDLGFILTGIK